MRLFGVVLAVLAATTISQVSRTDEKAPRSAELQVLDRFVGSWDFVVTTKTPQGEVTANSTETRAWSPGGRFVHFQNANQAKSEDPEFQMLITYDPATGTYPGVLMSGPARTFVDGVWEEKSQTMTFRGKFAESGVKFVYTNRFLDADRADTTGVMTNADGDVLLEQTQKQTRRRK